MISTNLSCLIDEFDWLDDIKLYLRRSFHQIQISTPLDSESQEKAGANIAIPLIIGLAIALGMFIGKKLNPYGGSGVSTSIGASRNPGKVEEILRYIDAKYVEDRDSDDLSDDAIRTIMGELDPHSTYHTAEEVKAISEGMRGNFDGIGIEFMILDDTIVVLRVMDDGPSLKAGLQPMDRIIAVGDSTIAGIGINSSDVVGQLKGPSGTDVDVTIYRDGKSLDFNIQRGQIATTSVDAALMLDDHTGYIKVDNFSSTTAGDFLEGLRRMIKEDGMKDLVIDLRGNPGGYLNQAVNILHQLFKEKDRTLVYTLGDKSKKEEYKTNGRAFFDVENVAVLIDEGSASASEIIAGALQDWDRAVIVGRRSYGKGLVQQQYALRDGSAIRLTISRYYTPSGRCIQKSYSDSTDYRSELYDRYSNGELYESDKIAVPDTTEYMTAGGRIVYAGGGISPDVFVPLDTTTYNAAFYAMRPAINNDVVRYFEDNDFSTMDLAAFASGYVIPDSRIRSIYNSQFPDQSSRTYSYASVRQAAVTYFKARLGRQIYGDNGFYAVWIQDDPSIEAALRSLDNPSSILVP